jgi:hypothetical protein
LDVGFWDLLDGEEEEKGNAEAQRAGRYAEESGEKPEKKAA